MKSLYEYDETLLGKLIEIVRRLQAEAGTGQLFKCPVKFVMNYLSLGSIAHASALLRALERKKILICIARGTKDTVTEKGHATLWKFNENTKS